MAITYSPIATTTLGSNQATVTFSSISASYTDLVLVISAISVTSGSICLRFNGDSGSNYSRAFITGTGSAVSYGQNSAQSVVSITASADPTTSQPNLAVIDIPLYSNTSKFKNTLHRSGAATGGGLDFMANTWRNTAAINSITILLTGATNFAAGSVFTLYQITAA